MTTFQRSHGHGGCVLFSVALLSLISLAPMGHAQPTADPEAKSPVPGVQDSKPSGKDDGTPSVISEMNKPGGEHSPDATPGTMSPVKPTNLSPAFVDRCLEVADDLDPQFAQELRSLCELDPAEFERVIRKQGPRLTGLAELKASDPDLYKLKLVELRVDQMVQDLARELRYTRRDAPEDTKRIASLEQQLRGQLQIRMGLELGNQLLYIQRMEKQLQAMRDRIKSEQENFDKVVELELKRLTGRLDPVQAARHRPTATSPAPPVPSAPATP